MEALVYEEPTILDTIVAFLPVVEATEDNERPLADHLKSLAALCRAFPPLGSRIGPQNRRFWQSLVLGNLDFTTHSGEDDLFYVIAYHKHLTYDLVRSNTPTPVGFPPREDWHWLYYEMCDFESSHGNATDCMLGEFPEWWPSIGAYFRWTEYAFLHAIQAGTNTIDAWPDHEDPFTLYCDLVLLKERLAKVGTTLETHGSGGSEPRPILMRRMTSEIGKGYPYAMLRHCHISPFFYTGLPPVSEKWSALDGPLPAEVESSPLRTEEEDEIFPLTPRDNPQILQAFRRLVHESFDDWRRVHVNLDVKGKFQESPEFYIGRSKKSGRWLGFVGESGVYCKGSNEAELTADSS